MLKLCRSSQIAEGPQAKPKPVPIEGDQDPTATTLAKRHDGKFSVLLSTAAVN